MFRTANIRFLTEQICPGLLYRAGKPTEPVENRVEFGGWGVVSKFVQIFRSKETYDFFLGEAHGSFDLDSCS